MKLQLQICVINDDVFELVCKSDDWLTIFN